MSVLRGYAEEALAAGNHNLYRPLIHLDNLYDQLVVILPALAQGRNDQPFTQSNPSGLNLPPPCDFKVIGVDGKFRGTVTLPQNRQAPSVAVMKSMILADQNAQLAPMVHLWQSATDLQFNATSNVTSYGPTSDLVLEVQDPNQTKFWRLQSSFDGVNFNKAQIFSSPITCGPVAVQSGFLRSTSGPPRGVVNNSNNATVDSVDNGDGTDTIRIYGPGGVGSSFVIFDGQSGQTTVAGGTVGGAAQSTFYQVVWSASTGFRAFPNATQYTSSLLDQFFVISGLLKTVAAGGGGGVTGGGGGSGGGGGVGGGGNKLPQL